MSKRVAVSIVTYNTDPVELRTVVGDLHSAGHTRICIVDNSPQPSLEDTCKSLGIEYIFTAKNLGYGAAHNMALRRSLEDSSIDYHLVLNSDMRIPADTSSKILQYMDIHPDVGQLIPRVNYPDGSIQPAVRLLPTPLDVIGRRFLPRWLMAGRNNRYTLAFWNHASELNIPYHQGSFMWFRTDALRKVGLFDERFFMYPEDIDITRRIHQYYKTIYWPGASVVHMHRAASYHSWRMLRIHMVNMVRYFNKWGWFIDIERRRLNREVQRALCQSAN